jgi:hypothetical protein
MQSFNYTPEDVFWGQLGGCLEAIDAGTTFVVDHAHMTYSPEHGRPQKRHLLFPLTAISIRSARSYDIVRLALFLLLQFHNPIQTVGQRNCSGHGPHP